MTNIPTFTQVVEQSHHTQPLESNTQMEENSEEFKPVHPNPTNLDYSGLSESEYYEFRYQQAMEYRFGQYGY